MTGLLAGHCLLEPRLLRITLDSYLLYVVANQLGNLRLLLVDLASSFGTTHATLELSESLDYIREV